MVEKQHTRVGKEEEEKNGRRNKIYAIRQIYAPPGLVNAHGSFT